MKEKIEVPNEIIDYISDCFGGDITNNEQVLGMIRVISFQYPTSKLCEFYTNVDTDIFFSSLNSFLLSYYE